MQQRKKLQLSRRPQRQRRASTPSRVIKRTSSQDAQRQHAKKQSLLERLGPKKVPSKGTRSRKHSFHLALAQRKTLRERWAAIALETQQIVLGNGQYVEERRLPSDSASSALPSQSLGQLFAQVPPSVQRIGHDLFPQIQLSKQGTVFYPHYSEQLAFWATTRHSSPEAPTTSSLDFVHSSVLATARQLITAGAPSPIGVLSFASPKKPGGGYLNGADEEEDVLARHSSLVASLSSDAARGFYKEHKFYRNDDGSGLHDHSMVYSPGVVVFRADPDDPEVTDSIGGTFISPYSLNVVSAVPVNAGMVRAKHTILPEERQFFEDGIRSAMKERMARALRIFEEKGNRTIVLGAFGCGSSQNNVEVVAAIWAELLVCGDSQPQQAQRTEEAEEGQKASKTARFKDVFERVVFAVPGKLFQPFKSAFEMRVFEAEVSAAASSD